MKEKFKSLFFQKNNAATLVKTAVKMLTLLDEMEIHPSPAKQDAYAKYYADISPLLQEKYLVDAFYPSLFFPPGELLSIDPASPASKEKKRAILKEIADAQIHPSYNPQASTFPLFLPLLIPATLFLSVAILSLYAIFTRTFFFGLSENLFIGCSLASGLLSFALLRLYASHSHKDPYTAFSAMSFVVALSLLSLALPGQGLARIVGIAGFLFVSISWALLYRNKEEDPKQLAEKGKGKIYIQDGIYQFVQKCALPVLQALPIAVISFSVFLSLVGLFHILQGDKIASLLTFSLPFFIIAGITSFLIGGYFAYAHYVHHPRHAGDIRNTTFLPPFLARFFSTHTKPLVPEASLTWRIAKGSFLPIDPAAAEEAKRDEKAFAYTEMGASLEEAADTIKLKKYSLLRVQALTEAAKYYVKKNAAAKGVAVPEATLTQLHLAYTECAAAIQDALGEKGDMTPIQSTSLLQSFHSRLLQIADCKSKHLALAEAFMIWQEKGIFEPKPISHQIHIGEGAESFTCTLIEKPIAAALTEEQQAEFRRIRRPLAKERPEWFKDLPLFAQHVLTDMVEREDWEAIERWRPTILMYIPGQRYSAEHVRIIQDAQGKVLSKEVSYRQGVPSPLYIRDTEERKTQARENIAQMLADLKQKSSAANFLSYWGLKPEHNIPCPIVLLGLVSNNAQIKPQYANTQFLYGASENNEPMYQEKAWAISQLPEEEGYAVYDINFCVNYLRKKDFDHRTLKALQQFVQDTYNFIEKVEEENHLKGSEDLLTPEEKERRKELSRIKDLLAQVERFSDPAQEYPDRNRALHLAGLCDLITQKRRGISSLNCKSSKDRTGEEAMYSDSMEIFYRCTGREFTYDATPVERAQFVEIFSGVLISGQQFELSHTSSPGAYGIKGGSIFDPDIKKALEKFGIYRKANILGDINKPGSFLYKNKKIILPIAACVTAVVLLGMMGGEKFSFNTITFVGMAVILAVPLLIFSVLFLKEKNRLRRHAITPPVYFTASEEKNKMGVAAEMGTDAYFISACIIALKDYALYEQFYFGVLWHFVETFGGLPDVYANGKHSLKKGTAAEKGLSALEVSASLFLFSSNILFWVKNRSQNATPEEARMFSDIGFAVLLFAGTLRAAKKVFDAKASCDLDALLEKKLKELTVLEEKVEGSNTKEKIAHEKLRKEIQAFLNVKHSPSGDIVDKNIAKKKLNPETRRMLRALGFRAAKPTIEERLSVDALLSKNKEHYNLCITRFVGRACAVVSFSLFAGGLPLHKIDGALLLFICSATMKAIRLFSQLYTSVQDDMQEQRNLLVNDIKELSLHENKLNVAFEAMLQTLGVQDKKEQVKYKIAYALRKKEVGEDADAIDRFLTHLHAAPSQLNTAVDEFVCLMQNIGMQNYYKPEARLGNEQDLAQKTIEKLWAADEKKKTEAPLFETAGVRANAVYKGLREKGGDFFFQPPPKLQLTRSATPRKEVDGMPPRMSALSRG